MSYQDRFHTSPSVRGKKGAEVRWGPPRRIHIGDLSADQRRLVVALVEAQRSANTVADGRDPKDGDR